MWLAQAQSFICFLAWAFAPKWNRPIQYFQSMVNISVSMATQSSDQDDLKSGVIIQMEGHTLTPVNGCSGPEEMEAFGSTSSHSQSQWGSKCLTTLGLSIVWRFMLSQLKMEEQHHPPHTRQAPVVGDMLWDGKSGLTEVVVTGPGWAILFYER